MSGQYDKRLLPHTPIRGSLEDDATLPVQLPIGTEYIRVRVTSETGAVHWSAISAAEAAVPATAWQVDIDNPGDTLICSPTLLWLHAVGAVDYEILVVREGRN